MRKDQRKLLMIHPCHLSPPHSLTVPQLPSYFLQKSQQQRRFQGSLISLACPNYSEAGHKDKHISLLLESYVWQKRWLTSWLIFLWLQRVCMYACKNTSTIKMRELLKNEWFHYSLSRVRPRSRPHTLQEAHSTATRFPHSMANNIVSCFTEKARPRCSYDIITHPTPSQARIPSAHTLRSSLQ